METKLEYLLDSRNTLNMFEIHKYWNKIFRKMGICTPKNTAEQWTYFALQYRELQFFRFVSSLKLVHFLDLLGFKYAYLYL